MPRNEDGTPQRFANPFDSWAQLQNDGGNTVPGRSNNCADCSRSFLESWFGNPQVSAPRTPDTDKDGKPDTWSPERASNENQIRWSGAKHSYAGEGKDPNTAARIANDLLKAGHGSAAIVQVNWPKPGGGGHAFNAVNYHGKIVWIDTQTGQVSHDPIHISKATHAFYIPLDANRQPLHADKAVAKPDGESATEQTEPKQDSDTTEQTETNTDNTSTEQAEAKPQNSPTEQTEPKPDNTPTEQAESKPEDTPAPHTDTPADESPSDADDTAPGKASTGEDSTTGPENAPTDKQEPTTSSNHEGAPKGQGASVSQHLANALRHDRNPFIYGRPEAPGSQPPTPDSHHENPDTGQPTSTPTPENLTQPEPNGPAEPSGDDPNTAQHEDDNKPPADPAEEEADQTADHDEDQGDEVDEPTERHKPLSASDERVDVPIDFGDVEDPGDAPDISDPKFKLDKSRGFIVETIDPKRVTIENELITEIDKKPVKQYLQELSHQRALHYAELGSTKREGPCSALAIDLRTGIITEGVNGTAKNLIPPEHLHPLLRDNYMDMAVWMHPLMDSPDVPTQRPATDENGRPIPGERVDWILEGQAHEDQPLRHAEVKAVNELLWARQRQQEGELDREVLKEMRFDPRWFKNPSRDNPDFTPGDSAPACANCNCILRDIPSFSGRYHFSNRDYRRQEPQGFEPPASE